MVKIKFTRNSYPVIKVKGKYILSKQHKIKQFGKLLNFDCDKL